MERERALLGEPDPVPPLLAGTADVLRAAISAAHEQYAKTFDAGFRDLEDSASWESLGVEDRQGILRSVNLTRRESPHLDTPAAILDALDRTSLSEWDDRTAALPGRFTQALQEAARRLEPKAVPLSLRHANLTTEEEVNAYLDELRARIMSHVHEGRPVIL